MKFLRLLVTTWLCVTALFSLPAFAETPDYDQIVIFGDSLSDNGNLYRDAFGLIPKSPPYYQGHFSNGPTWSDITAKYFADKANIPTANYALGGETVVQRSVFEGYFPYTIGNSITNYYLHTLFQDKSHTLFIIWIGANDYLEGSSNPDKTTTEVITTLQANIESLINAGGKNFLVLNIPDLALTPASRRLGADPKAQHELTLLHNSKLTALLTTLQTKFPATSVHLFDVYDIYDHLVSDTADFNTKYHSQLKNFTDSCWTGGYAVRSAANATSKEAEIARYLETNYNHQRIAMTAEKAPAVNFQAMAHQIASSPDLLESYKVSSSVSGGGNSGTLCVNPNEYAFWDHVHPTAAVHQILGALMIDSINMNYHAR